MISRIEGTVSYKSEKFLIVSTGGIGYKVYAPFETVETAILGQMVSLFTYLAVREDALDLYGFLSNDELEFFEMLISISGIGPKTAINILNTSSVITLKKAISTGDTTHLIKVSGIGKKIAEKISLELKDKFDFNDETSSLNEEIDAVEALKALGYRERDAREALKEIENKTLNVSEKIKAALKILGK